MADATASCPVCGTQTMTVVYDSGTASSLSSLCQILPGAKVVSYCSQCGHLTGNGVADAASFYETDYQILLDDEDEDQIYEAHGEHVVTRTGHQLAVLVDKLVLAPGQQVLDYGCAKAAMARKLTDAQPGLVMYLFDVSRMYEPFWNKFIAKERQAVHDTPAEWNGRFDLVTSFFAFEHITDPRAAMAHVAQLLKPDGQFYMVVPDVAGNAADFIVIDHVNHFTRTSAAQLMADTGFADVEIDAEAHRGALVVVARKSGRPSAVSDNTAQKSAVLDQAHALADFWSGAAGAVRTSEALDAETTAAAIYGAGFYGAFIHANLANTEAIVCFLDQSPWQQGKSLFDIPIIAPDDLPANVNTVYVGLNPRIARDVMATQPWFGRDELRIVYLE